MTDDRISLTDDIALRPARVRDAAAVARAYDRNRAHLGPWEPIRPDDYYTEQGQLVRLRDFADGRRAGRQERWVFDNGDGEVYGSITLSNIELGVFLNARLGYWVEASLNGRGLATAAVRAVCDHARQRWNIHRIEAGTNVENHASQRVLLKCGFEEIGRSRAHLFINGRWADSTQFHRILHTDPVEVV
ncbi:GNAT family protein [Catenulispora yoronensis]|uniref:GNAT family protein n=1 Tax=Catenulispora yoronensis TaxID=450799 RepID=A0ABP5H0B6_9ACTN